MTLGEHIKAVNWRILETSTLAKESFQDHPQALSALVDLLEKIGATEDVSAGQLYRSVKALRLALDRRLPLRIRVLRFWQRWMEYRRAKRFFGI